MVTHEMMETVVREHQREADRLYRAREARNALRRRRAARPRGGPSRPAGRRGLSSLLARLSSLASVF